MGKQHNKVLDVEHKMGISAVWGMVADVVHNLEKITEVENYLHGIAYNFL